MRQAPSARGLGPLALALALLFLGLPPLPVVPSTGTSGLFAPAPEIAPKAQFPLWGLGVFLASGSARPALRRAPEARLRPVIAPPRPERRRYLRLGRLLLEGG